MSIKSIVKSVNACILFLGISANAYAAVVPISLTVTPDILGEDWEMVSSGGFLPTYTILPTVEHAVTIGLSDGTFDVFTLILTPDSQVLVPPQYTAASFSNGGAMNSTLTTLDTSGSLLFVNPPAVGPITLIDIDVTFEAYDPQLYLYTLDGVQYELPKGFLVPIPPAVWLFGSGLIGLIGIVRRKKS